MWDKIKPHLAFLGVYLGQDLNNQEKSLLGGVEFQEEPFCIPKNILESASQRAVPTGRNRNEEKLK